MVADRHELLYLMPLSLARAGIPSALFGPIGSGLHGLDEWVEIDSVLKCRRRVGQSGARVVCDPIAEMGA